MQTRLPPRSADAIIKQSKISIFFNSILLTNKIKCGILNLYLRERTSFKIRNNSFREKRNKKTLREWKFLVADKFSNSQNLLYISKDYMWCAREDSSVAEQWNNHIHQVRGSNPLLHTRPFGVFVLLLLKKREKKARC